MRTDSKRKLRRNHPKCGLDLAAPLHKTFGQPQRTGGSWTMRHRQWAGVLTLAGLVSAAALAQSRSAEGTGFTFQGRLTVDGSPASGAFDLQFQLYADPTGGSPLGNAV